jgi:hypothetical protein
MSQHVFMKKSAHYKLSLRVRIVRIVIGRLIAITNLDLKVELVTNVQRCFY